MFQQSLSSFWGFAQAVADHLWQSTLFVAAAGLLTLALRKNSARLRYSLWLAASLKFLVPFSLLVALGNSLSWRHLSTAPTTGMYVIEIFGQPFTKPLPLTRQAVNPPTPTGMLLHLLPWLVLGLWLCGFLAVLSIWLGRWWRISSAIRGSVSVSEGRELSTLRRVERVAGVQRAMKLQLCRTSLEPGVFGILRPVLLWPDSISEHLDDGHLEAVLAHELCHVRRRDNLAAALHMLVEALFWFHPSVWWVGSRLLEERELACDEGVLELGGRRHIYAESILKVCEFCLTSPLTCVSGVTGSDLKKRMVHIMTDRNAQKLNFARKLLLWIAACLAIALPIAFGLLNATPSRAESEAGSTPKFTSVSIKPHAENNNGFVMTKMMMSPKDGGLIATNVSPHMLIKTAYRVQETQLVGEPEWVKSERYDIDAKFDQSASEQMRKLSEEQRDIVSQQMLRHLLHDYFKLSLHLETRDVPVYELVIANGGTKLQKTSEIGMTQLRIGETMAQGAPVSILTEVLSQRLGRTVVDKTGLTGNYVFTLHWTPDADEQARIRAAGLPPELNNGEHRAPTATAPPLLTAIQEQLGLELQLQTDRVQVLLIDHAERP